MFHLCRTPTFLETEATGLHLTVHLTNLPTNPSTRGLLNQYFKTRTKQLNREYREKPLT